MHLGRYATVEEAIAGFRGYAVRLRKASESARESADCKATEWQYRENQEWFRQQYLRSLAIFEECKGEAPKTAAELKGWVSPERAEDARRHLELIERDEYPGRWWQGPRPEPPPGLDQWQRKFWNARHSEELERWRYLDWSHAREREADEAERKAAQLEALSSPATV
jgi:hypothetical protein